MSQTLALDLESLLPVTLTAPDLSEVEFLRICDEFPEDRVEYDANEGIVIIMPPTDTRTSRRHSAINYQLTRWSMETKRGAVTEATGGWRLPNGSRRSPDASWFDEERWLRAETPGTRYPVFAPEFVIEFRSPSDRMRPLREKMDEYLNNGVQLGWLIDPQRRTVTIYRPAQPPQVLENPTEVHGEGPIEGFVLNLDGIFD